MQANKYTNVKLDCNNSTSIQTTAPKEKLNNNNEVNVHKVIAYIHIQATFTI